MPCCRALVTVVVCTFHHATGLETVCSNVQEPSKCEYTMTVETPAVCELPSETTHDEL
jgi:hypothetical protein